ncbi:hypothetical protein [Archangium lipolyticum]|uniref:hypothetical protein n=1 Tax=Archangium lipolyticum TaxID=2970465 RepID=UPI00214A6C5E|nr:hypothetical protein [Archangium lipolyticum]
MSHPRYFVPHAASPAEPLRPDPSAMVHAVDAFRLESRLLGEQELLVGTDAVGGVFAIPASERHQLPASVRAQLTHHEVASGRTPRRLSASELYFFSVELIEHPEDAQGINDPVYLYGTLLGPWPSDFPERVPGQLTVSRGDMLAGLVAGVPEAFHYVQDAESRYAPRAYHALLPGDRPERLAEGRGLVLAYPAVPAELQTHNAANGPVVARLVHDVLTQLQASAREHNGPETLRDMELPVPSRLMAIAELEMRGYEVEGDVATLRRNHPGLVNRLAEWLRREKVKVPPEASAPEFLELARRALAALPGWPSDSERALRTLVRPGNDAPARSMPVTPAAPSPAQTPLVQRPIPPRAPPAPARPSDWMKDFLDAHTRTGGAKPKLTLAQETPARGTPSVGTPEWMADFGSAKTSKPSRPARPSKPSKSAPAPSATKKPDWMSDFED